MLTPLGPDLWTIDHALTVGPLPMGTRTTVARLADGSLHLHSPGPLAEDDVAAIRALGPVATISGPNLLHTMFLDRTLAAFPEARGHALPVVAAKRKGTYQAPYSGAPGLEAHAVAGMARLQETVVFHPASRTLVLTDLCFNLLNVEGWFARTQLKMLDAYGRFGPSFLCRNWFTTDRAELRRSIDHLLAWQPEKIVVTHGEVVTDAGTDRLRDAFAWLK